MGNNVIYELSKKFAIRIIKLYVFLKEEKHEFVMSKQIYRCGTSRKLRNLPMILLSP